MMMLNNRWCFVSCIYRSWFNLMILCCLEYNNIGYDLRYERKKVRKCTKMETARLTKFVSSYIHAPMHECMWYIPVHMLNHLLRQRWFNSIPISRTYLRAWFFFMCFFEFT